MSNVLVALLAGLLSVIASLIPIPMVVRKLFKMIDKSDEIKIEFKDSPKELIRYMKGEECDYCEEDEDSEDDDDLDFLRYSIYEKKDKYTSTPPSPKPPKFDSNILYSSKLATLKELHEKRNLDKSFKKISFTLAVVMSIVGTIILFTGIIISFFDNKEIGWITTSSGAIIELVAGIYFWLINKTMKEVKDNSKQLEKTEDLFAAIELIEKISDNSIKDEAYKNIVDNLMNSKNK